ncbi:protein yiiY [Salmonella enterica subsp. enterica]|nr:protein yiiY [Salmonella enterica subsp. enterica]
MRKSLFLLLPLVVTNAHAVYVDVRHEYLDDSKANYDRAYISHRFANGFGFAIEAISKSGGDDTNKAFNDLETQGNEYTISYQFKTGDVAWQPGFVLETGNGYSTYKPYFRATWTLNESWWVGARYRLNMYAVLLISGMMIPSIVWMSGQVINGTTLTGQLKGFIRKPINMIFMMAAKIIMNITSELPILLTNGRHSLR